MLRLIVWTTGIGKLARAAEYSHAVEAEDSEAAVTVLLRQDLVKLVRPRGSVFPWWLAATNVVLLVAIGFAIAWLEPS